MARLYRAWSLDDANRPARALIDFVSQQENRIDKSKEPIRNSDISNHSAEPALKTTYCRLASNGVTREIASIKIAIPQYHFCVITNNVTVRSNTRRVLNKKNSAEIPKGSTIQATKGIVAVNRNPKIDRITENDNHLLTCPIT